MSLLLCPACSFCNQMVNNRPIRIDLANSSDQDGGPRRGGHFEDRSDWRRADDDDGVWRKRYILWGGGGGGGEAVFSPENNIRREHLTNSHVRSG